MVNLQQVESHNQVESGDILVHVEQEDNTITYKVLSSNWVGILLHLVQVQLVDIPKTTITLVRYDSPLKQVRLKKITLEK
jgi:hypothetical protein